MLHQLLYQLPSSFSASVDGDTRVVTVVGASDAVAGEYIGTNGVVVDSCASSVDGWVVELCCKVFFVINLASSRSGDSL